MLVGFRADVGLASKRTTRAEACIKPRVSAEPVDAHDTASADFIQAIQDERLASLTAPQY